MFRYQKELEKQQKNAGANSQLAKQNNSTLASTNRRDRLRTQGNMMEDTSDNLLQMGLIKNSMNDRSIEPSSMMIEMPKLSILAPNLSDAEAMMKFHMNNQSKTDSPLGDNTDFTQH